jgi:hypothetical protein
MVCLRNTSVDTLHKVDTEDDDGDDDNNSLLLILTVKGINILPSHIHTNGSFLRNKSSSHRPP